MVIEPRCYHMMHGMVLYKALYSSRRRMRVELISLKFITFLALLLVTYYVIGHFAPGRRWIVLLLGTTIRFSR